jgi:rhamnosyltransferase subunit B
MNFLLSSFGSSGDVFPMVGLALELRKRGHEVTFATNGHYGYVAEKHGIPFEPLGTEAEFQACINHPDLWHPQRAFAHVFRFLKPGMKRQYEIYADHAKKPGAVGITTCFGFGALLVQEKMSLPVVTVHLQPSVIWSDVAPPEMPGMFGPRWLRNFMYRVGVKFFIDPVVLPFLNGWRAELNLSPVKNITNWWHSPFAVACLFPEWFAPPQRDWPANLIQTDFPLWNDQSDVGLDSDVEAFLQCGDAPIAFTPGTTNIHGQEFFEAAIEACSILNRRGLLLTEFREQLPTTLPESVMHVRYAPFDRLLPRCAAFVHHGGVGSASQAMAAGIPQLIMPLAHDQFDNLARLKKLNLGDRLVPKKFTGPRVAKILRRLLNSPDVAAACRAVAEHLEKKDGLARMADAIESRVLQSDYGRK